MPTSRPCARRMSPRRCSTAAMRAAIPAAGAKAGAGEIRRRTARDARPLLLDDDRRADRDQTIELADVAVVHADTAVRDEAADQFRTIGAMDGIFAAAQGECGRAHRIVGGATGNDLGQTRIFAADGIRRRPSRPDKFAFDLRVAGPGHAGTADADREAQRVAAFEDIKKMALAGLNDDGP